MSKTTEKMSNTNFEDYLLQKKNLENASISAYCLLKSMDIEKTLL